MKASWLLGDWPYELSLHTLDAKPLLGKTLILSLPGIFLAVPKVYIKGCSHS
jgi:hypothetical protein